MLKEEHPIGLVDANDEIKTARQSLQKTLDAMPPWNPDNSFFQGEPDRLTKWRQARLRELRKQPARN